MDKRSRLKKLSPLEKHTLSHLRQPGSQLLFNVKGMMQIRHLHDTWEFLDMGREMAEHLEELGLLKHTRSFQKEPVLQGEIWELTDDGRELADEID